MARVRDARTTRAWSHAKVMHHAGAGTARGSVMQGSGTTVHTVLTLDIQVRPREHTPSASMVPCYK
eukprot:2890074-Prymnesium_polylepis.1